MSADEVRRLIESALSVDLAAGVAMRLAAVSTARRSELAALRWEDVDGELLSIDSQIVEVRRPDEPTILVDEPTKTGNVRRIGLDAASLVLVTQLFEERSPCGAWMFNVGATTLTGSDDAVR
jgi:integrase